MTMEEKLKLLPEFLTLADVSQVPPTENGDGEVEIVGCIYAPYKANPNIFQFYFNFLDIFYHTSMHPLFCNISEFYLIFYDFISLSIIKNNHLYLRRHFLF